MRHWDIICGICRDCRQGQTAGRLWEQQQHCSNGAAGCWLDILLLLWLLCSFELGGSALLIHCRVLDSILLAPDAVMADSHTIQADMQVDWIHSSVQFCHAWLLLYRGARGAVVCLYRA
jgi:hypothetical protein